jgi:lipoprotein-anchoring transpeptidase ErfK/SrfK
MYSPAPPLRSKSPTRLSRASVVGLLAFVGLGCGSSDSNADEEAGTRVTQVTQSAPSPEGEAPPGGRSGSVPPSPPEPGKPGSTKPPSDAPAREPNLGAMAFQTPVYPEMRFSDERLGYLRQGAKVPAEPTPVKKENCKAGWYKLDQGGYVCGKYATLDLDHARVKLGVRQPDLQAVAPYKYAYNRFHGTPLYKTLPTKEEMLKVEPHLAEKERERKEKEQAKRDAEAAEREGGKHKPDDGSAAERPVAKQLPSGDGTRPADAQDGNVPSTDVSDASQAVAAVSAIAPTPEEGDSDADANPKPWWQSDEKNPNVSLADLEKERGGSLEKRMVKGFFVAVDKTLAWNGRSFFRTTSGLLAPADRMWMNKPPEVKGAEFPAGAKGMFFVLSEKASKYELAKSGDKSGGARSAGGEPSPQEKMLDKGKLARHTAVPLSGETKEIAGTTYLAALDGSWVKAAAGTATEPGKRPDDVGPDERWVDVNLTKKTLVLFKGDEPVYAALISPGKRSRNKKKDHATPTGSFRVREKHVSTTMDGDGASGDLPYSIEDVPFVAYFKGSYALHAAFWHSNFGREMSHGCVNLAPRDAKVVFDFVDPQLPTGWHGVFATKDSRGSLVVLHE